jgi:hypothetical protein
MGKSVNKFAMATVFSACFYFAQKRRSPLTLRL